MGLRVVRDARPLLDNGAMAFTLIIGISIARDAVPFDFPSVASSRGRVPAADPMSFGVGLLGDSSGDPVRFLFAWSLLAHVWDLPDRSWSSLDRLNRTIRARCNCLVSRRRQTIWRFLGTVRRRHATAAIPAKSPPLRVTSVTRRVGRGRRGHGGIDRQLGHRDHWTTERLCSAARPENSSAREIDDRRSSSVPATSRRWPGRHDPTCWGSAGTGVSRPRRASRREDRRRRRTSRRRAAGSSAPSP